MSACRSTQAAQTAKSYKLQTGTSLLIFFTAAVWCVPFSGAVGLFKSKKTKRRLGKFSVSREFSSW